MSTLWPVTTMLITLPYCKFKSYWTNTKLYLNLIYRHADYLNGIYLKAANDQYAFKQLTPMILQLYMLLTSNVLLLNSVLSLDNGLPKYLLGDFCTLSSLNPEYISHIIMYVNSITGTALTCNSKLYFVTLQ